MILMNLQKLSWASNLILSCTKYLCSLDNKIKWIINIKTNVVWKEKYVNDILWIKYASMFQRLVSEFGVENISLEIPNRIQEYV